MIQNTRLGRAIGLLVHDLADQEHQSVAIPFWMCATTEGFGAPDVPGGEVDPSSLALILVLDASWERQGREASEECFRRRA